MKLTNYLMRRAKPGALGIAGRGDSDPLSPGERDRVRGKESLTPLRRQNDAGVSTFEQIEALVVHAAPFPLPALSLGEREKPPPRLAEDWHAGNRFPSARGWHFIHPSISD